MDGHINTVSKSSVHQMENYSDYNDSGTINISNLFIHKHTFHMVKKISHILINNLMKQKMKQKVIGGFSEIFHTF